ncbi:MAG TPA: hypothetical protein VG960_02390 [Caulobacteraceae bacterium]|nr:hypothetical protein [Caulobacteraceae bacterium]
MTDPIEAIRRPNGDRRSRVRRQADALSQAPSGKESAQLPVVIAPEKILDPQPVVAAQLMGQDGQKRGLRGGPQTLAQARAAYLSTEWSGAIDRRNRTGLFSKTKV